ncbi:MAG: DUF309 domain-containing protein [Tepidiformaceae bacterium]
MTEPRPARRRLIRKTITVAGNFEKGCADFNAGRYFECHEWFEEIWQEEQGAVRDLYKGLIQIAAAFVHLGRGKFVGAERLLRTGVGYLAPYREDGAMGFDVEAIAAAAARVHGRLLAAGPAGVAALDLTERPRYAFDQARLASEAQRWAAWGFDDKGHPLALEVTVPE